MKLPDITFQFTSGPSFILTFAGILSYAFKSKAPFTEVAWALLALYAAHAGKRLIQKLKDKRLTTQAEGAK